MTAQPYTDRAAPLEQLAVEGPRARLVATFEDGATLFSAVCEGGLSKVSSRSATVTRTGPQSAWLKTKNKATARFAEERRRGRAVGLNPPVGASRRSARHRLVLAFRPVVLGGRQRESASSHQQRR